MKVRSFSLLNFLYRYHFTLAVLVATAFFAYEGLFLYRYFYVALTESRDLSAFKQQGALEELRSNAYQTVLHFNEKRRAFPAPDVATLRDVFAPPKTASSPITPPPTASSLPRR